MSELSSLKVHDLMTMPAASVSPDTPLREVLARLREDCCRQLPVLDEKGVLVGIVTDRDVRLAMNSPLILHERWQDETLLDTMSAASCMTPDPVYVSPETPAHEAAELLSIYKFGALPVMHKGMLVGIVTVTDFLELFIDREKMKPIIGS